MIKYPFEVYKTVNDERICWVAKSTVLVGCVGQGEFLSDTLTALAMNEQVWLENAKKSGKTVPTT